MADTASSDPPPSDFDEQYVRTESGDEWSIRAEDDLLHADRFPKSDLWEENTFVMVAECGDVDLLLWATAYHLRGHGQNVWLIADGAEQETELIVRPRSARKSGLTDHDFVRLGWEPGRRRAANELLVELKDGQTTWRLGDRTYGSKPPEFFVRGEHGGVTLDLTFTQTPPAFWEWGDFGTAPERDRGGYDALCRVDGTVEVGGRVYRVENGTGLKERITVGASSDPIRTLPAPREMFWLFMRTGDTGVYLFQPGLPGVDLGSLSHEGRHYRFRPRLNQGQIAFTTTERWFDPRSGLYAPARWQMTMESEEAKVELDIRAYGRCWFNWVLKTGIRMNAFLLCTANGEVRLADGAVVRFDDVLVANNWLRTFSTTQETLQDGGG